jgi:hypothetical protein
VVHAGIKKNTFGRGGFTGINVSRNANIAIALNGGMASHDGSLVDLYFQTTTPPKAFDLSGAASSFQMMEPV